MRIAIEAAREERERKRVCCNCEHRKRKQVTPDAYFVDFCAIHGHYISYVECFEGWCRRWKKSEQQKELEKQFKEGK